MVREEEVDKATGKQMTVIDYRPRWTVDKKYYPQPTHVWNIPAGWTCPWASNCLTKADRDTGKLTTRPDRNRDGSKKLPDGETTYICYAARAERFPAVRDSRWHNFEVARMHVNEAEPFTIPEKATHVRVHGSGDFFNEAYFLLWMETARLYPDVTFWAFTKSIHLWVNNLDEVPPNFALTASRGSKMDHLIDEHGLRAAEVYYDIRDVPEDMVIDFDDREPMNPLAPSFALLENSTNTNQREDEAIAEHNKRAYELQGRKVGLAS